MELRCLGEPLLKFRPSPLLSYLAPSTALARRQSAHNGQSHVLSSSSSNASHHGFHTTQYQSAQSSSGPMADLDSLDKIPEQPLPKSTSGFASSQTGRLDSLLNSTIAANASTRKPYKPPTETSASMVDTGLNTTRYYNNLREQGNRSQGSLSRGMAFPNLPSARASSDPSNAMSDGAPQREVELSEMSRNKRRIRSQPSIGRTIEVDPERGADFGRALRTLEIQCSVNRVRADQQRQRFHERPGMKRKRLKSERWRKLFRESFRATVGRVKEMRRKGW